MKILQLISSLGNGGAEKLVIELANELVKSHQVTVCTFTKITPEMIHPKRLDKRVKLIVRDTPNLFCNPKIFWHLYTLLKEEKPDIVNTHLKIFLYTYILAPFFKHIKFFHTIHNILGRFKYVEAFIKLSRCLYTGNCHYICLTNSIHHDFKQRYPKHRSYFIENGITPMKKTDKYVQVKHEIAGYKKDEETIVFVTIGRFSVQKNFSMLVNVFHALEQEGKNVILLIIGDDATPDKCFFKQLQAQKGTNSFLLGRKDNIGDYLSCADALMISSIYEGMPIVALEAFSLGVPVITTPAGGLIDMITDKQNGFIAKDHTEEEYYRIILRFLEMTRQQREHISQQCIQEFHRRYSIQICASKYLNAYQTNS